MKTEILSKNIKKIHFTGIGGVSMSGIASYLLMKNKVISGSDREENQFTTALKKKGAKINIKHSSKNLRDVQALIVSSAISDDNVEVKQAEKKGIPILKRSEVLGEILSQYKNSVTIAGSHGKTTTTAMVSHILIDNKSDPTVFCGGEDYEFNNFRHGETDYVVAEACEFRNNFMDLNSKIKCVLNIDNDHLDSYGTMENLIKSFRDYVGSSLVVTNADDKNCNNIFNSTTVTFGIKNKATYMAVKVRENCGRYSFSFKENDRIKGRINLNITGSHNIYNALAAASIGRVMGVPFETIKNSLEKFKGVKRRNEYIGNYMGTDIYCDYCHHPSEIKVALKNFDETLKDYMVIFQPHTYSRTRLLMDDFVRVLKDCDDLRIYKTYSARENYSEEGSGKRLAENINKISANKCIYIEEEQELMKIIKENKTKRSAVILGAGDIYNKVKDIIKNKK